MTQKVLGLDLSKVTMPEAIAAMVEAWLDAQGVERTERPMPKPDPQLTSTQRNVLSSLLAQSDWMTGREVAESLLAPGNQYDGRSSQAAATRKVLKRLEVLGLIETQRVGLDCLYRALDLQA